ncbi:unnamed protein product [Dracunculus medinensis]|uniref:2-iminobutanoate/2-iminopropanoate deaminase n=1 Tax=Dracunculus medinensis TaxID=318479 RepID=A0A158Q437_DRAME|nr:unnamed protein product [Dracunculus medinensis]
MMSAVVRKIISTTKAPAAIGPYSQAVLINKTLYISGSLGLVPETGVFAGNNVKDQAEQSLKNIGSILEAAGISYKNVIKTTILMADMKDFAVVNEVYKKYFTERYPARTSFQVAGLPLNALVEIEAIAVICDIKDE